MKIIKETELILHPDGSIYHLKIHPENLADTVILVGDPGRVETISKHFDAIEFKGSNREIATHTGRIGQKRITVLSTGMGTDNMDIVINELDALVNIDLENRTVKKNHKSLQLIRLGTSGALQKDVPVDSMAVAEYGLGFDGLLHFYKNSSSVIDENLTNAFIKHSGFSKQLPEPYIVKSSDKLFSLFNKEDIFQGITSTAPGFYGPQGRELRLKPSIENLHEKIESFRYENKRIINFEMETSALYGLGALLGHHTLTICAVIANRITKQYNKDYKIVVKRLINNVLETVSDS